MKEKVLKVSLPYNYDPYANPRQVEAHSATETYILYGGAKGGGKTAWLVNEAIALSAEFPGNRGWIGCKYGTDFEGNALLQLLHCIPPGFIRRHNQQRRFIEFMNDAMLFYGGLGTDEEAEQTINNMPELGFFGFDQAEQLTERQFQLMTGPLRLKLPGIRYKGLLTCNPDPGWLRDRFLERVLPNHRFIPALPKDNPFLPADYIPRLYEMYPPNYAKRLAEGIWDVDIEGNYLIPYEDIRNAINRTLEPSGDKMAGVDVAEFGQNETVFILKQGDKVLDIRAWEHADTLVSDARVGRLIREHKPTITYIDSIGIGKGVLNPLKKDNFPVEGVNVGEKALDHESYANKRAELYGLLAKKFQEGTIDIQDNAKLASQLRSIKYDYNSKRQMYIISKKEDRKQSLDYADALVLAFSGSHSGAEDSSQFLEMKFWG